MDPGQRAQFEQDMEDTFRRMEREGWITITEDPKTGERILEMTEKGRREKEKLEREER